MTERKKYPHAAALAVAIELQAVLSPACERIVIAGSLRRRKPMVGDIELLYVSKVETRPDGLFSSIEVDLCEEAIAGLLARQIILQRPNVNGGFSWGRQNKLAYHVASGIPVDLFRTTPAAWWVALVIRTGSKETNLRLTTGAQKRGASLMAYGVGVKWSNGEITPAGSEQDVFQLCDVPYLEPEKR